MDIILRIFIILVSVLVFFVIMRMLVKYQLSESLSVFWLVIVCAILVAGLFPNLLNYAAKLLGIDYQPTLLFLCSTILLLLISFKQSVQLSTSAAKLNETAIALSILREEHIRLTAKVNEISNTETKEVTTYENSDSRGQLRDTEPHCQQVEA